MILPNKSEELDLCFHVKVDDYDYILVATSATMKCFSSKEKMYPAAARSFFQDTRNMKDMDIVFFSWC